MQVDDAIVETLHGEGWKIAIETNGTVKLPTGIDWICVSPKSADHTIRQRQADEYKVVLSCGQLLPDDPPVAADHYIASPAFSPDGTMDGRALLWCVGMVKQHPRWRLSVQTHKLIGLR